jgi:hypothetical protein
MAYKLLLKVNIKQVNLRNTVKLGYNELGYNELPLITNKFESLVGFQSFVPLFLGYNEQNPGYNEQMISLLTKISDLRFVLFY